MKKFGIAAALVVIAFAFSTTADAQSLEEKISGKKICFADGGKASYRADHKYRYTAGGVKTKARWSVSGSYVNLSWKTGSRRDQLTVNGPNVTIVTGGGRAVGGNFC